MEEKYRELIRLIHKGDEEALMEFYDATCHKFLYKMKNSLLDETILEEAFPVLYFTIQLKSKKIAKCDDVVLKCYEIIESVSKKFNKKYPSKESFKLENLDFSKRDEFDKEKLIASLKKLTRKEYKVFIVMKWYKYPLEFAKVLLNMKPDKINSIYNKMSAKIANAYK